METSADHSVSRRAESALVPRAPDARLERGANFALLEAYGGEKR